MKDCYNSWLPGVLQLLNAARGALIEVTEKGGTILELALCLVLKSRARTGNQWFLLRKLDPWMLMITSPVKWSNDKEVPRKTATGGNKCFKK